MTNTHSTTIISDTTGRMARIFRRRCRLVQEQADFTTTRALTGIWRGAAPKVELFSSYFNTSFNLLPTTTRLYRHATNDAPTDEHLETETTPSRMTKHYRLRLYQIILAYSLFAHVLIRNTHRRLEPMSRDAINIQLDRLLTAHTDYQDACASDAEDALNFLDDCCEFAWVLARRVDEGTLRGAVLLGTPLLEELMGCTHT